MAKGDSGRIVIEIDPALKEDIYYRLKKDGMTLKEWFLKEASTYLSDTEQIDIGFNTESQRQKQVG
jgi:hypothetical protein